jgi:hypothetical protein
MVHGSWNAENGQVIVEHNEREGEKEKGRTMGKGHVPQQAKGEGGLQPPARPSVIVRISLRPSFFAL